MTVRDLYNLACPQCGSDERIFVSIEQWVLLTPDGSETIDDAHEWGDASRCRCERCGNAGEADAFRLHEFTVELDVQGRYALPVLAHSPREAGTVAVERYGRNTSEALQFAEDVFVNGVEEGWS